MKKIRTSVILGIIGLAVIGTFYLRWRRSQPKTMNYEVVTVEVGDIENTSVATGKVSPRDEVLIKPQISGIISELRKEAGDFVRAGDIIAVVKVIPEVSQVKSTESRVNIAQISLNLV